MKIEKILNAVCKSGDFIGKCNFEQNKKIFEKIANSTINSIFSETLNVVTFSKENLNSCFSNQMSLSFEIEFQNLNNIYKLTFDCTSLFHDENISENFLTSETEICYTAVELLFNKASKITINTID